MEHDHLDAETTSRVGETTEAHGPATEQAQWAAGQAAIERIDNADHLKASPVDKPAFLTSPYTDKMGNTTPTGTCVVVEGKTSSYAIVHFERSGVKWHVPLSHIAIATTVFPSGTEGLVNKTVALPPTPFARTDFKKGDRVPVIAEADGMYITSGSNEAADSLALSKQDVDLIEIFTGRFGKDGHRVMEIEKPAYLTKDFVDKAWGDTLSAGTCLKVQGRTSSVALVALGNGRELHVPLSDIAIASTVFPAGTYGLAKKEIPIPGSKNGMSYKAGEHVPIAGEAGGKYITDSSTQDDFAVSTSEVAIVHAP